MHTSQSHMQARSRILVSGTKAAMSIFNNTQILDARKREILTEYLFEFMPSDMYVTHDVSLLDGFATLRLTVMKKSRRHQLLIAGAYLLYSRDNGTANEDVKAGAGMAKFFDKMKKAGIVLGIINGAKKLFDFLSGGSSH